MRWKPAARGVAVALALWSGVSAGAAAAEPVAHVPALSAAGALPGGGGAVRTALLGPVKGALTESWLALQPEAQGDAQFDCLATALYFEARGESVAGQAAVAEVILNRVGAPDFPRTVCGVVNQKSARGCQFSFVCDGRSDRIRDRTAFALAGKIARAMLDGAPRVLTDGATHFHTPAVSPAWSRRFERTARIGGHIFYRAPIRTAMN